MKLTYTDEKHEKARQYYADHREKLLAKQRIRQKADRLNDPERLRSYHRKWATNHPEKRMECRTKWRLENKVKERAQLMANRHVPLNPNCEICGSTEKLHRHHDDYSKPLEVLTLCPTCHKQRQKTVKAKDPGIIGQTRYLHGLEPVKILKDGWIEGEDLRYWKVQVIESGEIKLVYGSHCHIKQDMNKLVSAMCGERLRLGQIQEYKVTSFGGKGIEQ